MRPNSDITVVTRGRTSDALANPPQPQRRRFHPDTCPLESPKPRVWDSVASWSQDNKVTKVWTQAWISPLIQAVARAGQAPLLNERWGQFTAGGSGRRAPTHQQTDTHQHPPSRRCRHQEIGTGTRGPSHRKAQTQRHPSFSPRVQASRAVSLQSLRQHTEHTPHPPWPSRLHAGLPPAGKQRGNSSQG